MKLSFVIPALNEEDYIGRCLRSVLTEIRSSNVDAEIVVVDNASTDGTSAVAAQFPGVRIVMEPRRGLSAARHRGYLSTTGDIIANLDADTIVRPGWARKVMRQFDRDPSLVCLTGPFIYYDIPQVNRMVVLIYYCFAYLYNLLSQYVLRAGAVAQGGNFTCRRSALDKVGGYDTSIEFYGEDTDAASRLARVGQVKFSFRIPVLSSGRRLLKEGVWRAGKVYALNNIFTIVYGRTLTRTHTNVRPKGSTRLRSAAKG